MNNKVNIAIDGHSSCGKSTLAREIAEYYSFIYIDSGAMYRAVTLYLIENQIPISDTNKIIDSLDDINIDLSYDDNKFCILLNDTDVTARIISIKVSDSVSEVAAIPEVRKKLVKEQRKVGERKGVVMDGRDIGSVVFPDAEIKFFITANIDVRAERRFLELKEKNMETPFDQVKSNLLHRDHVDSTREESPLLQTDDAILIDNSYMDREEQLFICRKIIDEKLN